jgi:pyrroline-5-carboxylate reductase
MCLGGAATEEDGELVAKLFGSVGKIWRADEKLFDAIVGLRYDVSAKGNNILIYLIS